jgi:8-oxo-dGTP diphosphatase
MLLKSALSLFLTEIWRLLYKNNYIKQMNPAGNFIIRVYGLVINGDNEVLVSDEFRMNMKMTKFPGGGLHYGEGTLDCLKREFAEECQGQEIENIRHFYTTDYFQEALFYEKHQLISIYYQVDLKMPPCFHISARPFDFEKMKDGSQSFRWLNLKEADPGILTFPVDKLVLEKLKNL